MNIQLVEGCGPLYRQIVEAIRSSILRGELQPGTRLPSVRILAKQLHTSGITVHKAYECLSDLGLVESTPRSGSRVLDQLSGSMGKSFLEKLPNEGPRSNFEKVADSGGVRSMASSVSDPTLFYSGELFTEIEQLRHDSPWNFYYPEPAGAPELLTQIARIATRDGLPCNEASLIATEGGGPALSLLLEALTSPGDSILIQGPGKLWLGRLLTQKGLAGVVFQSVDGSLDFKFLIEQAKQFRPKVLLLSPDFGHTTGECMHADDRLQCIQFARDFGLHIIEDGSLRPLRYTSNSEIPVSAMDSENCSYIGSFSYSLCPGVRTGFIKFPSTLRTTIVEASETYQIAGSKLLQTAFARYLARGNYEAHLKRVLPRYQSRRDSMLSALSSCLPKDFSWTKPKGGLSTWVRLPQKFTASELYAQALSIGVAFAPGSLFLTPENPDRFLRLSFGILEPEAISEAVKDLARLINATHFN